MASSTDSTSFYGRSSPVTMTESTGSTEKPASPSGTTGLVHRHPGQHLDDADLLALRRQYVHVTSRDSPMTSSSNDDLSQLLERNPIHFDLNDHDYADIDDDDLHLDSSPGYDYETDIRDKLKKANEELKHDTTPAELVHPQRVSFDTVVKAVDIYQDPSEYSDAVPGERTTVKPISEKLPPEITESKEDNDGHEYTVPLNDTQPREGPSLLQQLKSIQFHGGAPPADHWGSARANSRNNEDKTEEYSSSGMTSSSPTSHLKDESSVDEKPVLVAINGKFEFKGKNDYLAQDSPKTQTSGERSSTDSAEFTKSAKDSSKTQGEPDKNEKPRLAPIRPKSSEPNGRNSTATSNGSSKSGQENAARAKSALSSSSTRTSFLVKTSGVDFEALNRKAREKKLAELEEEKRKQEEIKRKKKEADELAKEGYEKWLREKDSERQRIEEEKRIEREEQEARCAEETQKRAELREKKIKEWTARKDHDVLVANEFKRLQTSETMTESTSSINPSQRAYNQWLRRKNEQAREEKRLIRLEERRLRRRQRRSIKRFQLQQDLQLAKAFGYT